MASLIHQRCFNHALREAAARCPECRQFYCRECITEHDDRIICSTCLAKIAEPTPLKTSMLRWAWRCAQLVGGVFMVWLFFYIIGGLLLLIPSSFHEGSIWQGGWWRE